MPAAVRELPDRRKEIAAPCRGGSITNGRGCGRRILRANWRRHNQTPARSPARPGHDVSHANAGHVLLRHDRSCSRDHRARGRQPHRRRVSAQSRPRSRDLGVAPGVHAPGPLNAITDVDGVRVGHTTIIEGDRVRTGVTAVVPHGGNVFQDKVAGAVFVGNALRQAGGIDAGQRARHDRDADRADQHAQRRRGDGRGGPLHDRRSRATSRCDRSTRWSAKPTTAGLNDIRGPARDARARHRRDQRTRRADAVAGRRGRRRHAARSATAGRAASAPRRGRVPSTSRSAARRYTRRRARRRPTSAAT